MRARLAVLVLALVVPGSLLVRTANGVEVSDVRLEGRIDGKNITFTLDCTIRTSRNGVEVPVVIGDLAVEETTVGGGGHRLVYHAPSHTYRIYFPRAGKRKVNIRFAARPRPVPNSTWRQAAFTLPASDVRALTIISERTDLEVRFPRALRVDRVEKTINEKKVLTVTAVLGPGHPFVVTWKPQVQAMEGRLVLASEANTIATVIAGALRLDSLFAFEVTQGEMRELSFIVPKGLSVAQVNGAYIQIWNVTKRENDQLLTVALTQPQKSRYFLQIRAEMVLEKFPVDLSLPTIEPFSERLIRSTGHLVMGSDGAIKLVMREAAGVSQIDAAAFPRCILSREHPRQLPTNSVFYYRYAASPYRVDLTVKDVHPAFDADPCLLVTRMKDDDFKITAEIQLDVREAPIRDLTVRIDKRFIVSDVKGALVADYDVVESEAKDAREVLISFRRPVLGRTALRLEMELGRGPLETVQKLEKFEVVGAKSQRGYIVLAADSGIRLEIGRTAELRSIHTAAAPARVPEAQFAYRFRDKGWSIEVTGKEKAAAIRCETFHLASLGDGILYGSVVVTYSITGAPVDELKFRIPGGKGKLEHVEFIGRDVRSRRHEGDLWTVTLQRKVAGDYQLLITYNQHYTPEDGSVLVGGVACEGVDRQVGYIAVGGFLDAELVETGQRDASLLEVDRDEIPSHYLWLLKSTTPILRSYKYVKAPHQVLLKVTPYGRHGLLDAVIDRMDLRTEITPDGEAVTRATYWVKNSSNQFLNLRMPKGATVWSAHVDGRPARPTGEKGLLKIRLNRHPDPNTGTAVEVVYGESCGKLRWRRFQLTAPLPEMRATSAQWKLTVSSSSRSLAEAARRTGRHRPREEAGKHEYVFSGLSGTMAVDPRTARPAGLVALFSRTFSLYDRGLSQSGVFTAIGSVLMVVAIFVFFFALRRRGWIVRAGLAVALVFLLLLAVLAVLSQRGRAAAGPIPAEETASFSRALVMEEGERLLVSARLVPAWAGEAFNTGALVAMALTLVCVVAAVLTRRRLLFAALAVAAACYAASWVPAVQSAAPLLVIFALPLVPLVLYFARWLRAQGRTVVVAAALLAAVLLPSGCVAETTPFRPTGTAPVFESAAYQLKAEKDCMEVTGEFIFRVEKARSFPLVRQPVAVLEKKLGSAGLKGFSRGGGYWVHAEKPGRYTVRLKFLVGLAKEDETRTRRFLLQPPLAVRSSTRLRIEGAELDVRSPTAVALKKSETPVAADGGGNGNKDENEDEKKVITVVAAVFGPGANIAFEWKPQGRQTKLEKTVFFADVTSVTRFDAGVAECTHLVRFQIAQGEIRDIRVRIPEEMVVTGVDGRGLGTWRFDPAEHMLLARLQEPVAGEYRMLIATQVSLQSLPQTVTIGIPEILKAGHQRGTLGLASLPSVQIQIEQHPPAMNEEDFIREAGTLLQGTAWKGRGEIRHAYRYHAPGATVVVKVTAVTPEIRTTEWGRFDVAEDRLIYTGVLRLAVAKSGVFHLDIDVPAGYDIESLKGYRLPDKQPIVSHWDDQQMEGGEIRRVRVHFRQKLLGQAELLLRLGRTEDRLPEKIVVPRVLVVGELKHSGGITVLSERGIRLLVDEREGVSDVEDPEAELGVRLPPTPTPPLAFKILRRDWRYVLKTERVDTRMEVNFLHLAEVSEGLVKHTVHINYRLFNVGTKVFELKVPSGISGLQILGSNIARSEPAEGRDRWRVELARKVVIEENQSGKYSLQVRYESRYDMNTGKIDLEAVRDADSDLQQGYVAVHASEKVEVTEQSVGLSLKPMDSRSIPGVFGAGSQAGAVLCYRSIDVDYALVLKAVRHDPADVLPATVRRVQLVSLITEDGQSITRVTMSLSVGSKRHLELKLPAGAQLWSLTVNTRSVEPSRKTTPGKEAVLLLPLGALGAGGSGETLVELTFTYAAPAPAGWARGRQRYLGPRFDLPLQNVDWEIYLPPGMRYGDCGGTMPVRPASLSERVVLPPDEKSYRIQMEQVRATNKKRAEVEMQRAIVNVRQGYQKEARLNLERAYNLSLSDRNLNEDARVKLQKLQRDQAVAQLINRRYMVQEASGGALDPRRRPRDLGERFTAKQAEQEQARVGRGDNASLNDITDRIFGQQDAASGQVWALQTTIARRGKRIAFSRRLQVKPDAEMRIEFSASRPWSSRTWANIGLAGAIFLAILLLAQLARRRPTGTADPEASDVVFE